MTIAIPEWLLWVGGIVGGIAILGLAALGVLFILFLKDFRPFG